MDTEEFFRMESVGLDKNIHELLTNDAGVVEQDEKGNWLVINTETKEIFAVYPNRDILSFFGITEENENIENVPAHNDDGFTWNRTTTWLLIREFQKHKDNYRNPKIKKRDIWQQIQGVFDNLGYKVTIDALDRKFRNLKKTFKSQKDKSKKTGRGPINWEFFDEMDNIFFDDATINFPKTISSMPSTSAYVPSSSSVPAPSTSTMLPSGSAASTAMNVGNLIKPSISTLDLSERVLDVLGNEEVNRNPAATPKRRKTPRSELCRLRRKHLETEKERIEEIKN